MRRSRQQGRSDCRSKGNGTHGGCGASIPKGERNLSYRILRAIKNRYGSTNEIGVFEMGENGLDEVTNPSKAMLEGRPENVSGTCVACA